jgi:hypothetical protein
MTATTFLVLNLALAFYDVGAIWAHEVDIFRSWRLVEPANFHHVQRAHWKKLPYWVFVPVGLSLIGAVALIWYHPPQSPAWAVWTALACQLAAHIGTAVYWGPLQARLSQDSRGSASPYLERILSTHWLRTLFINSYAFVLFWWTVRVLP